MKLRVLRWLVPVLFVFVGPSIGQAGTITITGGTAGTIPGTAGGNDAATFFGGGLIGGYYGASVDISIGPPALVTVDYFGGEADFNNAFSLGATQIFDHASGNDIAPNIATPDGTFTAPLLLLGLLAFHFDINSPLNQVFDGTDPDNHQHLLATPNFFVSCSPFGTTPGSGGTTCDRLWIFLDDSGGGPDGDYDDLVLRVTVEAVPEPVTLGLLGIGLIGGGLMARRRR